MKNWRENCLAPSSGVTREQTLWLLRHTLICSLVCAGVNFAISYLSFHGEEDPTLWNFPTPISGSFAVTLGLELTLNWIINCTIMTHEVITGKIPTINPRNLWFWPKSSKYRWWLNGSDLILVPDQIFICWMLWGNYNYNDYPLPEILIALYGVLLVVVTIPFWGLMILADLGERLGDPASDPLIASTP